VTAVTLPRSGIAQALGHLDIDVAGKRVLDVGPGDDMALEWCRLKGAKRCFWIDNDDKAANFQASLGIRGVVADHEVELGVVFDEQEFDLVWAKSSISAALYLDHPEALTRWLGNLTRIGSTAVVTPHWSHDGIRRLIVEDTIAQVFADAGWSRLPWIEGCNREPMIPWTWVKRCR
jgi:predicted nicotinamide N-methyase